MRTFLVEILFQSWFRFLLFRMSPLDVVLSQSVHTDTSLTSFFSLLYSYWTIRQSHHLQFPGFISVKRVLLLALYYFRYKGPRFLSHPKDRCSCRGESYILSVTPWGSNQGRLAWLAVSLHESATLPTRPPHLHWKLCSVVWCYIMVLADLN